MLLLTAEESARLDRVTIESGRATGLELMERAGRGVAEAIVRRLGSPLALNVLVLCGPGNNGGDGFVAARHLASMGASVAVAILAPPERLAGDALAEHAALLAAGIGATPVTTDEAIRALALSRPWDIALDALLGTGASGEPRGALAAGCAALCALRERGTRIVAVDLPTGVSADDGSASDLAVRADLTVTFGFAKRGHALHPGRELSGVLEVVDIGLAPPGEAGIAAAELSTREAMAALVPRRGPRAHKGDAGRVLVVGGSMGLTGAVALAARAASRSGAGLVRVAVPASLNDVLESKLTEEMTVPLPETTSRSLGRAAIAAVLDEAARSDVVALGPGLSRNPDSAAFARELVARCERPLVLDADGLNAFAGDPDALARSAGPRVLTPHLGELSRLTGQSPPALEARRIDAAREWAARFGAVLVVKGAPTVTADGSGAACVNSTGNPGMAAAGMGDVLTGAIAAWIAQGASPYDAARLAVHLHGAAGDLAAAELGPRGLVASDVSEQLPRALAALLAAGR